MVARFSASNWMMCKRKGCGGRDGGGRGLRTLYTCTCYDKERPLTPYSGPPCFHSLIPPTPHPLRKYLLRVVFCHFVSLSLLELITSLLQSGGHDMLHTEQWVVSEVKGGEINVQLVDFLLYT